LSTRVVPVADGLLSPANSWFAWTPDAFCASAITNTLYWKGSESRWTGGAKVYKMDIDSGEQSLFVDLGADGADWKIYGCSMRVHPVTDQIYMSLYKSYGSQSYVVRRYGTDATLLGEYAMEPNYWFPALPVFPEASSSSSVAQADDAAAAAKGDLYDLCGRLVAAGVACPAAAGVKAGIYVYRTAAGAWKIAIP
jgi:hypothetical protein